MHIHIYIQTSIDVHIYTCARMCVCERERDQERGEAEIRNASVRTAQPKKRESNRSRVRVFVYETASDERDSSPYQRNPLRTWDSRCGNTWHIRARAHIYERVGVSQRLFLHSMELCSSGLRKAGGPAYDKAQQKRHPTPPQESPTHKRIICRGQEKGGYRRAQYEERSTRAPLWRGVCGCVAPDKSPSAAVRKPSEYAVVVVFLFFVSIKYRN